MRVAIEVPRSGRKCLSTSLLVVLMVALSLSTMATAAVGQDPSSEAAPSPFRLVQDPGGGGYRFAGFPIWLGGDATISGAVPEHDPAFAELDEIDLLLRYEPTARLSFFTETRLDNTITWTEGHGVDTESGDLSIERLYVDVLLTPQISLRIGKLLTPFGLWNVIRRAPLSWTVERPAVTEFTFPEHTTGLSLTYQTTWHGWSFDAAGYGPAQDKLAFRESAEGDLLFGGRVAAGHSLGSAFATLGLDAAGFDDNRSERWADTYGADLEVDVAGQQITGEFAYSILRGDVSREFGAYLQDAIPILPTLYGVVRFDYFQPRRGSDEVGGLIGVFWRPYQPLILKLNYQFANRSTEELNPGLLMAGSLFF